MDTRTLSGFHSPLGAAAFLAESLREMLLPSILQLKFFSRKSENNLGWKGPVEVTLSNLLFKARSASKSDQVSQGLAQWSFEYPKSGG